MRRAISVMISMIILSIIFYKIEVGHLVSIFKNSSLGWMSLAVVMFIPTTIGTAYRFKILAPKQAGVSYLEALRLVLAGSSLNMVLPSKMGDIAKGYFVNEKAGIGMSLSLSLVVYEKACDVLSLLMWCVVGLVYIEQKEPLVVLLSILVIFSLVIGVLMIGSARFTMFVLTLLEKVTPNKYTHKIIRFMNSWKEMCTYLSTNHSLILKVITLSILIWALHLLQIWFFVQMLNGYIPLGSHLALTPLAIFTGLLPFTYAGIGTRDAALIYFLRDFLAAHMAAALGLLCTFRYIVPALIGLPFLSRYMYMVRQKPDESKDAAQDSSTMV
jgi:uncharacterized protein (TIRG00374 family)